MDIFFDVPGVQPDETSALQRSHQILQRTLWRRSVRQFAHLEEASHLIVIFAELYSINHLQEKQKVYYSKESVCIATGMLISALTYSGICTLTHTPQPAGFLNQVLNVEPRLKPVLILACGYPDRDLKLVDLKKKKFDEVCFFNTHKKMRSIQKA